MIEEIKKEILKISEIDGSELGIVSVSYVFEILDKYNNQPDYKEMWEELKSYLNFGITGYIDSVLYRIQEIEQKYNLGGE